ILHSRCNDHTTTQGEQSVNTNPNTGTDNYRASRGIVQGPDRLARPQTTCQNSTELIEPPVGHEWNQAQSLRAGAAQESSWCRAWLWGSLALTCRRASNRAIATAFARLRLRAWGRIGIRSAWSALSRSQPDGRPRLSGPKTRPSPARKTASVYTRVALV